MLLFTKETFSQMIFNIFKKKGLIQLKELYWPQNTIQWPSSWWPLSEDAELRLALQQELHKEIGPKHPLWGLNPVIFAKSDSNDDVLVHLNNQKFAIVHLLWHGHIDQLPEIFPSTQLLEDENELQHYLDYKQIP